MSKVSSGDPLKIPALTWNDIVSASKTVASIYPSGNNPRRPSRGANYRFPWMCTNISGFTFYVEPGYINGLVPYMSGVPMTDDDPDPRPSLTATADVGYVYAQVAVDRFGVMTSDDLTPPVVIYSETLLPFQTGSGDSTVSNIKLVIVEKSGNGLKFWHVKTSSLAVWCSKNQVYTRRA